MQYTLAFDVYGTLIDTSGISGLVRKMVGEKAVLFMETWRNKQLEYSFRRGVMDQFVDFSVCTREALVFCCHKLNVELGLQQKDTLMEAYNFLPAFPEVASGLKKLKKSGHKLYAFSNGGAKTVSDLLVNAGIIDCFDGIVSVEGVKVFKPSPLVYEHFNRETNSSKSNSWLISSNPFDVIGAISYGMRSVWVKRSQEALFDPWGIEPTKTITGINVLSF